MPSATFWIAIVLAAGAGVALAVVWMDAGAWPPEVPPRVRGPKHGE